MTRRWVSVCAGLAFIALPATPVLAQGSSQPAFGSGPPLSRGYRPPTVSPYRSATGWSAYSRYRPGEPSDHVQPYDRASTVRTLCVRMCDGFYFPISGAILPSELARDANKCSAMCTSEAHLFYHSTAGGSVEEMVDLTGRAYCSFPNAYKYRKTLVEGCTCRPQPWSDAERQRHRSYKRRAGAAEVDPAQVAKDKRVVEAADPPAEFRPFDGHSEADSRDRSTSEQREVAGSPSLRDDVGVSIASEEAIFRPEPIERQTHLPPPSWYAGARRDGHSSYDSPADQGRR